jgi:hypothetical protein
MGGGQAVTQQTDRLNAALTGRYTIERELGAGGMATVYLAEDLKHKRKVALKVLKPELAAVLGTEPRAAQKVVLCPPIREALWLAHRTYVDVPGHRTTRLWQTGPRARSRAAVAA